MYDYLLLLALIMISTKICGLLTEKVSLPQVLGSLLAGIILGPSFLGILYETDFLIKTSEIGVILLMFIAGLDTDMEELKKTGKASFIIAMLGVIVPLFVCTALHYAFYGRLPGSIGFMESLFIGVVFSATSVSITVETLNEMGKLKTKAGTAIIGAAIIDDIIGIVVLSVVSGFHGGRTNLSKLFAEIALFFVFTAMIGFFIYKLFQAMENHHAHSRRVAIWALAFCFILSYIAETFFGLADITGAYFAGVILCNLTRMKAEISKKLNIVAYVIFSPVFFASIGIKTNLNGLTGGILMFALLLFVAAVITKIIGCGLAAKLCGLTNSEAITVGVGMVARGEVAFMVAQKGINSGIIDEKIFPAVVLAVIGATLITPILLKIVAGNKHSQNKSIKAV